MCPLKTQDWRQITSKWPVIFFPFVYSLSPEFRAPLTCSKRLALVWHHGVSALSVVGTQHPSQIKFWSPCFRRPQGNVLSHFTASPLVPAWLGKDLISGKRSFCLFVCLQSGSGTGRNKGPFVFRALIWQDPPPHQANTCQCRHSGTRWVSHGFLSLPPQSHQLQVGFHCLSRFWFFLSFWVKLDLSEVF